MTFCASCHVRTIHLGEIICGRCERQLLADVQQTLEREDQT